MTQLTTEALSRPMRGTLPGVHFPTDLQTPIIATISVGLVAHLTSVRPFPQAEDDTNQRKARAAVTNRSLQRNRKVTAQIKQ